MPTSLAKFLQGELLEEHEFLELLTYEGREIEETAGRVSVEHFWREIKLRGLIELSNYCRSDCYYCGIRASNKAVDRYRLTKEEILEVCSVGEGLGLGTFVLQGGEDPFWRGARLVDLVQELHRCYPKVVLTLSLGEMSRTEYQELYDAGARRYLLRHETIDPLHFKQLHPPRQRIEHRIEAIHALKEIGFETGVGGMVGSPGQKLYHLARDLAFIQRLQPAMIGIGPFLPHHDTPFRSYPSGSLERTVRMVALCRLICPTANIPATTAVASLSSEGRRQAIEAGANVVMPNLSPPRFRKLYQLYDHKASFGSEAAEGIEILRRELSSYGFTAK
ncbi:[FeFe] hydrogenase H-cluster radical SAM maturase HydE [uncultured Porphyromonas sp.]|uniref:[FeFe] hydrogenase H-cluster radical SAM maturase HydE n=1 Tax=uncultured Porphyromonas sp. TaxID=159274 RepID=UPI0005E8EF17|nr:[FeFe] hydrogenase H-cluster radical SAM maturase HydE [uncultured Porphyromonas sp.]CQB85745.1 Biotin synthase [Chlamydia trachomatis]